MDKQKRNFDKEASFWDNAPGRVTLANDVVIVAMEEISSIAERNV